MKIKELKKLVNEIVSQEIDAYDLKVQICAVLSSEYYGVNTLRKKTPIDKLINLLDFYPINNFYDEKNNKIVIFLDNYLEEITEEKQIFRIIFSCFHEARHVEQPYFSSFSYEFFLNFIDEVYMKKNFDYNFIGHDSYSFEIGANLYSIRKTIDYLKKFFPKEFLKIKDELEMIEYKYYLEYLVYDAPSRFDFFVKYLEKYRNNKIVKWDDKYGKFDDDLILISILKIFINDDGSFKKIREVLNNERFNKIDKRIIYTIYSSESILTQIDINSLDISELQLLLDALNYATDLDTKQIKWLDELYKQELELYKYQVSQEKSLIQKYSLSIDYLESEIKRNIRFGIYHKNEQRFYRQLMKRQIEDQLEKKKIIEGSHRYLEKIRI